MNEKKWKMKNAEPFPALHFSSHLKGSYLFQKHFSYRDETHKTQTEEEHGGGFGDRC